MKKTVYDHGLPFAKKTSEDLDLQLIRIKRKKASLIIIDGGVGEGKTTLAVHIADYLNGKPINFSKQLALGGEQFQEKLRLCYDSELPVLIYDEAGDFNKRGALTAFNRQLNRIFETYRGFKIIVIVVLPNFSVLDKGLFDKKIPRLLIHCNSRTRQGNYSVYSYSRMMYINHYMKKEVITSKAYSKVSPNHRGHFLDLESNRSYELDRLSTKGKLDIVTENILENKGLMTFQQIAKKLKKSVAWVRLQIGKKKIKHNQLYKRKKYFNKDILDILGD